MDFFSKNSREVKRRNLIKYRGIPPAWELIEKVIKKSGLKRQVLFEEMWNIPEKHLTKYKNGVRILSARYWHIFYEFDTVSQIYSKLEKKSKSLPNKVAIPEANKQAFHGI